jgi:hypothetical protein
MANAIAPKGFVPVRHFDGTPYNGATMPFVVPSSDATAVFVGDLVKKTGIGVAAATVIAGQDCEGFETVALATAGTTGQDLAGPVVAFSVDPTALGTRHRLASTARIAHVCVDRSVVFEAQEDAVTTPIVAASVGLNAAYTTTAGNATTGISKQCIQSTSVATTATLPLRILQLTKKVGNALNTGGAAVDPATFDVMLNTGGYMPNVAGV